MNPRILIRGTNWVGDCVMSLAALRELRRLFPSAHLSLLVRGWVAGLFNGQELVDEILVLDEGATALGRVWRMPSRLQNYDFAILFQNAFEAALIAKLAGIPNRIGYATDTRGPLLTKTATPRIRQNRRHQVYYYLDLLYQTGLATVDYLNTPEFQPDIGIRPSSLGLSGARALLEEIKIEPSRPLIGLNPGAYYGSAKRWFPERYASLADRLIGELQAQVVLIGHGQEIKIADEIRARMSHTPFVLTGRTDLESLIGLLSGFDLLITNDSGPMHLAAALDLPQVALFGSTDEVATGPFSRKALVIHKHVECSPCLLRECPIDLRCFDRIQVDEVFQAVRRIQEQES